MNSTHLQLPSGSWLHIVSVHTRSGNPIRSHEEGTATVHRKPTATETETATEAEERARAYTAPDRSLETHQQVSTDPHSMTNLPH